MNEWMAQKQISTEDAHVSFDREGSSKITFLHDDENDIPGCQLTFSDDNDQCAKRLPE